MNFASSSRPIQFLQLTVDEHELYELWLRGGLEPTSSQRASEDSAIFFVSPAPWAFWVAAGLAFNGKAYPVIVFKNSVPLVEFMKLDNSTNCVLRPPMWEVLRRRLLIHNPGLGKAVDSLLSNPRIDLIGL